MPAPCRGVITRWEVCFIRSRFIDTDNAIDFVVLRFDQNRSGYLIVSVHELHLSSEARIGVQCDYTDDSDGGVHLEEGDVLGFVNRGTLRIALALLPEGSNSILRVFQYSPEGEQVADMREGTTSLLGNGSIQQGRFEDSTLQATPLIRIILSELIMVAKQVRNLLTVAATSCM